MTNFMVVCWGQGIQVHTFVDAANEDEAEADGRAHFRRVLGIDTEREFPCGCCGPVFHISATATDELTASDWVWVWNEREV